MDPNGVPYIATTTYHIADLLLWWKVQRFHAGILLLEAFVKPEEFAVPSEDGPRLAAGSVGRGRYPDFIAVVLTPATADRRPEDRLRDTDLEMHQREPIRAGQHPEPVVFPAKERGFILANKKVPISYRRTGFIRIFHNTGGSS